MPPADAQSRALSVRLFLAMLATQELFTVYIGVRLGLYQDLLDRGPACSAELADRMGLDERYVREWLEQQAVAGLLQVTGAQRDAGDRRYQLPAAYQEVLTVSASPLSMVSLTALPLGGVAGALPRLLQAFRDGTGVPDELYGDDWRDGHGGVNRTIFDSVLPNWLSVHMSDTAAALRRPGSRVADVCCGAGWAGLALARVFPNCAVDGIDLDEQTIENAVRHAQAAGLSERVSFTCEDATGAAGAGDYDLVLLVDALHEVASPARLLAACRRLMAPHGAVLVMDARVQAAFCAPGDEIERFQYATSILHCLPVGRTRPESSATGTVLRSSAVAALAGEAGFARCDELAFDDRFHRVYRLVG